MIEDPEQLAPNKVWLYSTAIITAAVVGFLFSARMSGILACQAPDAPRDEYLAYCNVANFGDYDHGAFWYGLEPTAIDAARTADVLFVGNSRMQFALSTNEVDVWFGAEDLSYYLLGFSHNENHRFLAPLLQEIQPGAMFYVLNVDDLFADKLTGPANDVMNERESPNRYAQKKYWLKAHAAVCGTVGRLCGHDMSFIRKRTNGAWTFKGEDFLNKAPSARSSIQYDDSMNQEVFGVYLDRAKSFLDELPVGRECIALMNTPGSGTSAGTVAAVAETLQLPLVAPQMDGLFTFDGAHLDGGSASRWSAMFVRELTPFVHRCLGLPK